VFGLRGRAIDLNPLPVRPLDVLGVAEAAIDEMAAPKAAGPCALALQHRPHEAAIGSNIGHVEASHDLLAGHAHHVIFFGRP
jgi:hypothetical protein